MIINMQNKIDISSLINTKMNIKKCLYSKKRSKTNNKDWDY